MSEYPQFESASKLYANLMEQVKRRVDIIMSLQAGKIPIPRIIAHEFCYLQLRLICELIALGCLVAHGDIPATRKGKMLKYYAPDDIIRDMELLHRNFFPKAGEQVVHSDGPIEIKEIESGYLTKTELSKLWAECGRTLHVGNLKSILKEKPRALDSNSVKVWTQKIITLLNHHQIELSAGDHQWFVIMNSKSDHTVHVTLFKKIGPDPYSAP